MKEIMFNRKDFKSYENFYADVYKKLDGKRFGDFDYCKTPLGYNPDTLDEFLWYCLDDGNKYIFVNFDKEKIALEKNYDDYEYNIVFKVFHRFVKNYPNNALEFKMDDEQLEK